MSAPRRASLALLLLAGACTPCLGVIDCESSSHRSVTGQVLDGATGAVARDVVVRLVAGYADDADSVTTVTDAKGLYELTLPVRQDSAILRLRVLAPGAPGYTVDSLRCHPVVGRGDGCVLEPVLRMPRLSGVIALRYRQGLEIPASRVRVTFEQTGGTQVLGQSLPARFSGTTDDAGNVQIFGSSEVAASSMEPMVGVLTVELPPPIGTMVATNHAIRPRYLFNDRGLLLVPVGPSLEYTFVFIDSTTGKGLAGVEVNYERLAGVQATLAAQTFISDGSGIALMGARPLEQGSLTAAFTVRARGRTTQLGSLTLPTFAADTMRTIARYRVGAAGDLTPMPPAT